MLKIVRILSPGGACTKFDRFESATAVNISHVKSSTSVEKRNIAAFIRVELALENTMLLEYNGVRNIFLNKIYEIYDIWIIRILIKKKPYSRICINVISFVMLTYTFSE